MTLNQETKVRKSIGVQPENSGNHGSPVPEDETIGKIFQHIHVNPRPSTAFYAYLKKLYQLLMETQSLRVT